MRAFAFIRSSRRLSALVVIALLALGAVTSLHHHRLAVHDDATRLGTPEEDHPARTIDCVVCRAADAVQLVAAHESAPDLIASSAPDLFAGRATAPAVSRTASPRAPPTLDA